MVDPIVQRATQQIAEQSLQQGASQAGGQSQVNAADQVKFDQAMGQPNATGQVQAMQNANAVQNAQGIAPAEGGTLGDAILDGLEQMRTRHDVRMENIQNKLVERQGEELTVQDAMALQFEV